MIGHRIVGFLYLFKLCERETSPLATRKPACGDRQLWKMTAENMLLHDVRRFRKVVTNLIPIPMEDEAREHF